jgi:hypothetical protein
MIKFTTESGSKLRIDPDEIASVSSTRDVGQVELMFMDGTKVRVLGTVADVFEELEREADDD